MTYCLGIAVERGLVFVSDSRTNAGADQIGTYSKMHRFCREGERSFALLAAGNLATTQSVIAQIEQDIESHANESLMVAETLDDAADYVGRVCVQKAEQARDRVHRGSGDFVPEASFILGGEIRGGRADIAHIYPEGNFVHASGTMPFLQIGEVKYGKPILDRIIHTDTSIHDALKAALVSMDSTMRSNATVGPPVECFIYRAGSLSEGRHLVLDEHHEYLLTVRRLWAESLRHAFDSLPDVAGAEESVPSVTRLR